MFVDVIVSMQCGELSLVTARRNKKKQNKKPKFLCHIILTECQLRKLEKLVLFSQTGEKLPVSVSFCFEKAHTKQAICLLIVKLLYQIDV